MNSLFGFITQLVMNVCATKCNTFEERLSKVCAVISICVIHCFESVKACKRHGAAQVESVMQPG